MENKTLTLCVAGDHPVFAGHFPGAPIVPGVLLIDWAIAAIERAEQIDVLPGELSVVKFLSPVLPGETLTLHYSAAKNSTVKNSITLEKNSIEINSATAVDENNAVRKINFRIERDKQLVTSGTLTIAASFDGVAQHAQ